MMLVAKYIDSISTGTAKFFSLLLWVTMAITAYEVIARYVFNAPTLWAIPLNQRLFAAYFIMGGGYAIIYRTHVRIDVVYRHFPAGLKTFIDLVIYPVMLFAVAIVCIIWGGKLGLTSLKFLEIESIRPFYPVYPAKLVVPLAGILLLIQGVAEFIRNFANWRKREQ